MNDFKEAIKREQSRIQRLIDLTGQTECIENRGILLLEKRRSSTYCYEKKNNTKQYLGTPDSAAAKNYVKDRFLAEKRSRLITDRDLLEDTLKRYRDYSAEAVMASLPKPCSIVAGKQDFNDARYEELKQWADDPYEKNQAPFPNAEIYAIDGTRVRSKGECLHYNILLGLGIPFRYDSMIAITDNYGNIKYVSPDFLIQCYNFELVIIEHLGRLFDKGYALDFGEKCYWYLQAGFILGKNFFVTSDDIHGGTDTQAIYEVAKAIERLFYAD